MACAKQVKVQIVISAVMYPFRILTGAWMVADATSSILLLMVTTVTSETISAISDNEMQSPATIRTVTTESLMMPSLLQAYCIENNPTQQTATTSSALAVIGRPAKETFPADNDTASMIEKIASAAVADHVNPPRRDR